MKKTKQTDNQAIIRELCIAYGMELEMVQNYIANSVHHDGVRSDVIKKALAADVPTESMHAQHLPACWKRSDDQWKSIDFPRASVGPDVKRTLKGFECSSLSN